MTLPDNFVNEQGRPRRSSTSCSIASPQEACRLVTTLTVDMNRVLNELAESEERYGEVLTNAEEEPAG